MELLSSFLGSAWSIFLIVLFFGGSIFVHELGHFLAARRRGVKVERFSIGFGPRIFGWRGRDGVEYRLSWFPLGGYVALPQLADMSEIEGESSAPAAELPPISYSTKLIVFAAGAFFNFVFALLLATLLWQIGRPAPASITTTTIGDVSATLPLPDGTKQPSPAAKAGLRVGDVIRRVDGREVRDWIQFKSAMILGTNVSDGGERAAVLTIEREGQLLDITVNPVRFGEDRFRTIGIAAAYIPTIDAVVPDSLAAKIGFRAGDRMAGLNGAPLHSFSEVYEESTREPRRGYTLTVERDGNNRVDLAVPAWEANRPNPLTGLRLSIPYQLLHDTPWHQITETIDMTVRTFWSLISPRGDVSVSNLSGPIGIGRGFWEAAQSDYPLRFAIWFAILVNVNLAIFNLLPIPVLDGGHMLFATISKLRGRNLSPNFVASLQSAFIVLLFGMIIYVSFFDVRRIVRDVRTEAQAREAAEEQKK